ncbi:lysylphosphatidylglycerol synthase transmembrane domain-containing protein [Anoxybacteroides tepidamans]|uniref:lysylphosphatidylglycerol synthase transmembrane domain-containing protein n=1 Tax=Anoxybacteroides tepidamans TaxID=265948 RepID=UPI000488A87E|nr:lysylphosphatidylglycerol synthase transmembrane domain-containing protein [Anoxybacillus tepidamans]
MTRKHVALAMRIVGLGLVISFLFLTYRYFDAAALAQHVHTLKNHIHILLFMFAVYGASFWLRALAWRAYVGKPIPLSVYMKGLFLSLFINHISPIKIGDVSRIAVLARQSGISLDESAHSVAVIRLLDMLVLFVFSACGMYAYFHQFSVNRLAWAGIIGGIGLLIFLARKSNTRWMDKHWKMIRKALVGKRGVYIGSMIGISWLCEAVVVYEIAHLIGVRLSVPQSIWVNSVTVSGQLFQMAPGGLATYETVMAFAITRMIPNWHDAYAIAVMTHAFKFLFSYVAGVAMFFVSAKEMKQLRSLWRGSVRK